MVAAWDALAGLNATQGLDRPEVVPPPRSSPLLAAAEQLVQLVGTRMGSSPELTIAVLVAAGPPPDLSPAELRARAMRASIRSTELRRVIAGQALPEMEAIGSVEPAAAALRLGSR